MHKRTSTILSKDKVIVDNFYYRKVQELTANDSFSLVLPKKMCDNLNIRKGDYVKVVLQGKTIIVTKAS